MEDIPLSILIGSLFFLILVSGFFSGSETGLMSLNRYRLRHLADQKNRGAIKAQNLLNTPERLIGLILLGNNFVNILASAIATVIGMRLYGEAGILISTMALTVVILIFAEVTPKTLAAIHPERLALPSAHVLQPLNRILYPFVWLVNLGSKLIFKLLGLKIERQGHHLSSDELRIVVNEAGSMIPQSHQKMLLSILDLEKVSVDDIMVPRNEVIGIDIEADWNNIVKQITQSQHTRLPVYEGDINNVVGMIHLRRVLQLLRQEEASKEDFRNLILDAYFVPEGTPLNTQLLNFQHHKRRIGLVVDEYGEILGLVTLEDILEEIVGEFTTDPAASSRDITPQEDGHFLVNGSISVRELNRVLNWELPTDGPKTLNGLITEYLEHIPDPGTSMKLGEYPIEILQTSQNAVKTVLVNPNWNQESESDTVSDA